MKEERRKDTGAAGQTGGTGPLIRQEGGLYIRVEDAERLFNIRISCDDGQIAVETGNTAEAAAVPPEIAAAIDAAAHRLREIAAFIHAHPETGDQEFRAAEILTAELARYGFAVEKGLDGILPSSGERVHLATAFKAVCRGKEEGPSLGIMLEYDALPMGHGCGHNLIATAGLAAAIGLGRVMADIPGRLVVLGTPAEDGGKLGGKIPMVAAGHFAGIDAVLTTHGGDRWDTGSEWLAVKGATFTFRGAPAHAAAAPHEGRSALDAAVLLFSGVEMLREHMRPEARVHGIITEGGTASNIVPEKAVARISVRSLDNEYLGELAERVEAIARGAALAAGCTVESQWSFGYKSPVNVPALDALVLDCARQAGAEGIKRRTALASSDLGDVGQEIPTANLWFKAAPEGTELHTTEFRAAAASAAGIESSILAGRALAAAGYRLLTDRVLRQRVQAEFAARKKR